MNKVALFLMNDEHQNRIVPFLSILLGFMIGAIILVVFGLSPMEAYQKLYEGAFGDIRRVGNTLLNMTSLILTGLSVAFAFRTGLFNIGASGQMLVAGFSSVTIGALLDFPRIIHLPLAVLAAFVIGGIWAFVPAILKAKYQIHEVVTCIMMNWIAVWSVYYLVPRYVSGNYETESAIIKPSASLRVDALSELFNRSNVNLGLFIALIATVIIWFILEKTTFGYELKAVGFNKDAAHYAGIKVDRNIVFSMMISGGLAGLAGATYYLGHTQNLIIGTLPALGFDGIAVSLLGLNTPLGVVLAGLLFGFMNAGKGFMQSATGVPNELVPIIMATIIFFAATNLMIKKWIKALGARLFKEEAGLILVNNEIVEEAVAHQKVEDVGQEDHKKAGDQ